jgi:hypothetical protein
MKLSEKTGKDNKRIASTNHVGFFLDQFHAGMLFSLIDVG